VTILLIRLRLIGDVVFTTPVIAALKHRFPGASLTYLVEPAAEPVVRHNPHLDRVLVVERPRGVRRLWYDWALARRLRRARFDLVIDFHGGPRSAWLTRASGAPTHRLRVTVPPLGLYGPGAVDALFAAATSLGRESIRLAAAARNHVPGAGPATGRNAGGC
jgi:hypothetical protein